jgi:hypothetical protein
VKNYMKFKENVVMVFHCWNDQQILVTVRRYASRLKAHPPWDCAPPPRCDKVTGREGGGYGDREK